MKNPRDYIPEGISLRAARNDLKRNVRCPTCGESSTKDLIRDWVCVESHLKCCVCYGCATLITQQAMTSDHPEAEEDNDELRKLAILLEQSLHSTWLIWLSMLWKDTFSPSSMNSYSAAELQSVRSFIEAKTQL